MSVIFCEGNELKLSRMHCNLFAGIITLEQNLRAKLQHRIIWKRMTDGSYNMRSY